MPPFSFLTLPFTKTILHIRGILVAIALAEFAMAPGVRCEITENFVVYENPREFAGWPANEGLWAWGNELLAAFEVAQYDEHDKDHNIDRNSPKRIQFARSLDGGKTWKAESHPEIGPPEYLGDPDRFKQKSPETKAPTACPGGIDFADPNFAMKVRGSEFYTSTDRGRSWAGPYLLPDFGHLWEARTSYLVTGPDSCLLFLTAGLKKDGMRYSRSCVLETTDGGKSFRQLSWIGGDITTNLSEQDKQNAKEDSIFSVMPSAVRLDDDRYICALRQRINRRKWTDVYESADGGKTWKKLSVLEQGSANPCSLVHVRDQNVAAIYGNRRKAPFGISAKLSKDGGKTWSEEIPLRQDAREWDLGYTRAALNAEGEIVSIYYYTTAEIPQNFIAATLWKPSSRGELKSN